MKKMRIVGINNSMVFVQREKNGGWEQEKVNKREFEELMKTEYPEYYKEYLKEYLTNNKTKEVAEFFYNYGETETMKEKGEAFVYQA